jgi:beta propeller repeat protein
MRQIEWVGSFVIIIFLIGCSVEKDPFKRESLNSNNSKVNVSPLLGTTNASDYSSNDTLKPAPIIEKRVSQVIQQLTNDSKEERDPIIVGRDIIYHTIESGTMPKKIYLLNLDSRTNRIITQADSYLDYDFSGEYLVWSDRRNGDADVFLYDFKTGKERQLTEDDKDQFFPRIHGNYIVWCDQRNTGQTSGISVLLPNYDIFYYDIALGKEGPLITAQQPQYHPAIQGVIVAWEDGRDKGMDDQLIGGDIYVMNLTDHKETKITDSRRSSGPVIGKGYLAYADYRNNKEYSQNEIFLYDVSSMLETKIFENSASKNDYGLEISDGFVVWIDATYGQNDRNIVIYSIDDKNVSAILKGAGAFGASLDSSILVYTNRTRGQSDLFLLELSP